MFARTARLGLFIRSFATDAKDIEKLVKVSCFIYITQIQMEQ